MAKRYAKNEGDLLRISRQLFDYVMYDSLPGDAKMEDLPEFLTK